MTKEGFTCIAVVMDMSGSMAHLAHDTIISFNTFHKDQQAQPGEAVLTLCVFNNDSHLVHDFAKITSVSALDDKTYRPGGGTALLDAMGDTIESLGKKLAAMPEEERPSKVITLVITDGEENSSKRFTAAKIKEMVKHQQDVYNWEFVFMGANIDAITAGTNLGISMNNTMNYSPTKDGTRSLYQSVSNNISSYRGGAKQQVDFFNQQPDTTGTTVTNITTTTVTPTKTNK